MRYIDEGYNKGFKHGCYFSGFFVAWIICLVFILGSCSAPVKYVRPCGADDCGKVAR